jgi:primosomal protein N'
VERSRYLFPPFCYLLKLTCRRASQKNAQKAAQNLVNFLKTTGIKIVIEGPAPSFREKVRNKFQWQLILKAKQRSELTKVVRLLPKGWQYDIDPTTLL